MTNMPVTAPQVSSWSVVKLKPRCTGTPSIIRQLWCLIPDPLLLPGLCLPVSLPLKGRTPRRAAASQGHRPSIKAWHATGTDRAVKQPRGCHRAGQMTQPGQQSGKKKNGTCKCNFPLLRKCCDMSGGAPRFSLIAMKLFDVASVNQSKQITASPPCRAAHQKFIPRPETDAQAAPRASGRTTRYHI